jgi:hypothetical protein
MLNDIYNLIVNKRNRECPGGPKRKKSSRKDSPVEELRKATSKTTLLSN